MFRRRPQAPLITPPESILHCPLGDPRWLRHPRLHAQAPLGSDVPWACIWSNAVQTPCGDRLLSTSRCSNGSKYLPRVPPAPHPGGENPLRCQPQSTLYLPHPCPALSQKAGKARHFSWVKRGTNHHSLRPTLSAIPSQVRIHTSSRNKIKSQTLSEWGHATACPRSQPPPPQDGFHSNQPSLAGRPGAARVPRKGIPILQEEAQDFLGGSIGGCVRKVPGEFSRAVGCLVTVRHPPWPPPARPLLSPHPCPPGPSELPTSGE